MDKKKLTKILANVVCPILFFAWLLIAVLLLGPGDELTAADIKILIYLGVAEAITLTAAFFLSRKVKKAEAPEIAPVKSAYDKLNKRRGALLTVAAYVIAFAFCIGGLFLDIRAAQYHIVYVICLVCCCALPLILGVVGYFIKKRYEAKLNNMRIAEKQQYMFSHRAMAAETAAQKLRLLKKLKLASDIYAGFLALLGAGIAVCGGALFPDWAVGVTFISAVPILACLARIRFPLGKEVFEDDESCTCAADYPELYRLAEKARATLGRKGEVRISFDTDCNAGISKVGNTYLVQLGVVLLNIMSEDELYCILLHEFSHMLSENGDAMRLAEYNDWLVRGGNQYFCDDLLSPLFSCFDTIYNFQYFLYRYSSTVETEEKADRSMAHFADKQTAASALLKLKYYELFDWENSVLDDQSPYVSEEPAPDIVRQLINRFKALMPERTQLYNKLAAAEILAKNASHPTVRMRLDALNVHQYQTIEQKSSQAYLDETNKALSFIDGAICKNQAEHYADKRKEEYLKPKELIDKWESDGCPLIASEYSNICSALRSLGRLSDAETLCDRAIAQLTKAASRDAMFIKGVLMIHRFDPDGIDYIYKAMENNGNYTEVGLEQIGNFCCIAGLQEQLEQYRERSVELLQRQLDLYDKANELNAGDDLSTEHLPEELLHDITELIASINTGCIQKVYLVRKTVTEDFFTSVLVMRFDEGTADEVISELMMKLANYLCVCDDRQFSLFEYSDAIDFDAIPDSCIYERQ